MKAYYKIMSTLLTLLKETDWQLLLSYHPRFEEIYNKYQKTLLKT